MPRQTLRFGNKVAMLTQTAGDRGGGYLTSTNDQLRPLGTLPNDLQPTLLQFENAIFQLVCGDGEVTPEITRNRLGEEITFGQTVRLLHVTSNSMVCENRRVRAAHERACHKISLERFNSPEVQHSRWRILPRYRVRSEGSKICDRDVIILRSVAGDTYLHVATSSGTSTSDHFFEANSSSSATGFSLEAYDVSSSDPNVESQLLSCGVSCLQLLHREERAMVACVGNKDVILSPLRISGVEAAINMANLNNNNANNNKSSNSSGGTNNNNNTGNLGATTNNTSNHNYNTNQVKTFINDVMTGGSGISDHEFPSSTLFVIEQQDVFVGGPVLFGRTYQYRLKSLLTNHYLCLEERKLSSDEKQQQRRRSSVSDGGNLHPNSQNSLADQAAQKRKHRRRRASMLRQTGGGGGGGLAGDGNHHHNNNNGQQTDLLAAGATISAADFDLNEEQMNEIPFAVDEYELTLTADSSNKPGSIISFHQAADDPSPVARNHSRVFIEFPLLRDGQGLWLCSGFSIPAPPTHKFSEADDVDLRLYIQAKQLLCASVAPQKDGIEILKVPPEIFQDLNFVVSLMPPFEKLRQALELYDKQDPKNTSPSLHLVEQVRENLSLLINHCTKSKEMNPLIREGTPDFTSQCRIAEQNIAPILLDIVELALDGPLDADTFSSPLRNPAESMIGGNNNNNNNKFNQGDDASQDQHQNTTQHPVTALNLGNNLGDTRYQHHHFHQNHHHTPAAAHHQRMSSNTNNSNTNNLGLLGAGGDILGRTAGTQSSFMNTTLLADLVALQNALTVTIKYSFRLMRQIAIGNERTSDSFAPHLDRIFEYCPLSRLGVKDALYEIFRNHSNLVDRPDDLSFVHRTVELVKKEGRGSGGSTKLLSSMCTCSNRGLPASQNFVGEELLKPAVEELVHKNHTVFSASSENDRLSPSPSKVLEKNLKKGLVAENWSKTNNISSSTVSSLIHSCPFYRLWFKSKEEQIEERMSSLSSEHHHQQQEQEDEEKEDDNNNNNNNPFSPRSRSNSSVSGGGQEIGDDNNDNNTNKRRNSTNHNKRKRRNSQHQQQQPPKIDPDLLPCGVFVDMHNIAKLYNRNQFSTANVFDEFEKTETKEGVPIETFCAMSFGKTEQARRNSSRFGGSDNQSDRTSMVSEGPLSFGAEDRMSENNHNNRHNNSNKKRTTLSHVQGLSRQFNLLAACCADQNEKNILLVHELVPLEALLEIVRFERLPGSLRAEAFNLIIHAYLVVPGRRNLTEELQSVVHVMDNYQGRLEKKVLFGDDDHGKNNNNEDAESSSSPRNLQGILDSSIPQIKTVDNDTTINNGGDLMSLALEDDKMSNSDNNVGDDDDDDDKLRATFSKVKKVHMAQKHLSATSTSHHNSHQHFHSLSGTTTTNSAMMLMSPAKNRVALDTTIIIDENEINKKLAQKAQEEFRREEEERERTRLLQEQNNNNNNNGEKDNNKNDNDNNNNRPMMMMGRENFESNPNMFRRAEIEIQNKLRAELILTEFIPLLESYLSRRKAMVLQDKFESECINSAVSSLCALIRFGWISRPDFVRWLKILTPIADGRDDIGPANARNYDRYAYDEQNHVVMECKLKSMEAVNLLATIVRGDIVDRIVGSFEAGNQIPYVSEILDFQVGSHIHRRGLELLMKREEQAENDKSEAESKAAGNNEPGLIMGELHAFRDLTSDVLEAVGVDQVVKKLGKLIEEEDESSEDPLSYLSDLIDVLLDNALYEYHPVVASATELLLDLTNTTAALQPMMRRVQILPSAEAVKFYESIKPLQTILSKFENATISAVDVPVIFQTTAKMTQLLMSSDPRRLAENHKIIANMRLHTVVANLLEGTPLAFINAVLVDQQQQQEQQQQMFFSPSSSPGLKGTPSRKGGAFNNDEFNIHITGASQANVLHHHQNQNNQNDDTSIIGSPKEQPSSRRPNSGSNFSENNNTNNNTFNRKDSFLASAAEDGGNQHNNQHHMRTNSVPFSSAASATPSPRDREEQDFSPSFIIGDQQFHPGNNNNNNNPFSSSAAGSPNFSQQQHGSSPRLRSSHHHHQNTYQSTPNEMTFSAIDGNILAQAAAATFAVNNNKGNSSHQPNNNPIFGQNNNNNSNNKLARDTSTMIQVSYQFLLAMLSVKESAHEIQSDLIPYISTFSNQLPISSDIISSVLCKMFYGRIDICTSVQEGAIQDISSMLLSCNNNPRVAHVLRILIFQEDQTAFDLIQSNAESVLRSLLETEGLNKMLHCRDFFTGKHAVNFIREALSNVHEFISPDADQINNNNNNQHQKNYYSSSSASPQKLNRTVFFNLHEQMTNNMFPTTSGGSASFDGSGDFSSLAERQTTINEIMIRYELLQTICFCMQCSNVDSILKSEARIALFGDSVLLDDLPYAIDQPVFISALFLRIFTVAYLEDSGNQIQFIENPNFIRILRRLDSRLRKMIERIATSLIDEDLLYSSNDDNKDSNNNNNNQEQQHQTPIRGNENSNNNDAVHHHIPSPSANNNNEQQQQSNLHHDNDDENDNNNNNKKKKAQISHAADVVVMLDDNNEEVQENAMTIFNNRKHKSPKAGLFSSETEWYWLIHGVVPFLRASLSIISQDTNDEDDNGNGSSIPHQQQQHHSSASRNRMDLFGNNLPGNVFAHLKISPEVHSRLKNISQHAYHLLDVAVRENLNYELAKAAADALHEKERKAQEEEQQKLKRQHQQNGSDDDSDDTDYDDDEEEDDEDSDNDDIMNVSASSGGNNNSSPNNGSVKIVVGSSASSSNPQILAAEEAARLASSYHDDDDDHQQDQNNNNQNQNPLAGRPVQQQQQSSPSPSSSPQTVQINTDDDENYSNSNNNDASIRKLSNLSAKSNPCHQSQPQASSSSSPVKRNNGNDNDDDNDDLTLENTQIVLVSSGTEFEIEQQNLLLNNNNNDNEKGKPSLAAPALGLPPLSPPPTNYSSSPNHQNTNNNKVADLRQSAILKPGESTQTIIRNNKNAAAAAKQASSSTRKRNMTDDNANNSTVNRRRTNRKNNTTTLNSNTKKRQKQKKATKPKIATSLRSPSSFFFMENPQYDPDSLVTVRTLPQSSIKFLLDVVVKTYNQGRLEFLHPEDLKNLHDVVSKLASGSSSSSSSDNNNNNTLGNNTGVVPPPISKTTLSTPVSPIQHHNINNENNNNNNTTTLRSTTFLNTISADVDFKSKSTTTTTHHLNNNQQQSSSPSSAIYVFTEWQKAINFFSLGSEGTIETTAYRTTARVTLRKGVLGHRAIKNMITIVNSHCLSDHNRARLLMMLKQVITAQHDPNSEAVLLVSEASLQRNLKMSLLSQELRKQNRVYHQSFNYDDDNNLKKKVVINNEKGGGGNNNNAATSSSSSSLNNNNTNNNNNNNSNNISWEAFKDTLSLNLDLVERQNIFAAWQDEYQLGPKLVTLLSSSNKNTILSALHCGNALLLNGNKNVQDTIYNFFIINSKEDFFVYCRRFFVICRDQIRDRRRTLKRWIDELQVVTKNNNHSSHHRNHSHNHQKSTTTKKTNIDNVISSMELIEGLYDFSLPVALLRFVQLLTEGHHHELQSYLRFQGDNQVSINVIESVISILEELAASIDHGTFELTMQTLATLVEVVQGPCVDNQKFLISQNIGGVISTIFSSGHPLLTKEQLWNLRNSCVTLLLALQEGHLDLDLSSSLIQSLDMASLVRVMDKTYFLWRKQNSDFFSTASKLLANDDDDDNGSSRSKDNNDYDDNNNNNNRSSSRRNNDSVGSSNKTKRKLRLGNFVGNFASQGFQHTVDLGKNLWRGLIVGEDAYARRQKNEFEDELNLSCGIFIFMKTLLDVSLLYYPKIEPHQLIVDKNGISIRDLFHSSSSYKDLSSVISSVEIMRNGNVERAYFRVPEICFTNLQEGSKKRLIQEIDRSGDGGRIMEFHERLFNLLHELDFYDRMRRTRGLSLVYHYSGALDHLALLLGFVMNLYLLAFVSFENEIDVENSNHIPPGTPQTVYFALQVSLCVLYSLLFINFWFGNLKVYLNEQWQLWQEDLNKEAIAKSKENLSIDRPKIEDNPKNSLFKYEVLLYNAYFTFTYARTYQYSLFLIITFVALFINQTPYLYCILPLSIVWKWDRLTTVAYAVSQNKVSLALTFLLLLATVNVFSMAAYFQFNEMFDEDNTGYGGNCDSLLRCYGTSLVYGLLSGGGLNEVVRPPIYTNPRPTQFYLRLLFEFLFFIVMILLLLNLVFGIILESFSEIRQQREFVEKDQQSKCFICGLERGELDKITNFENHIQFEHHMWNYLYFMKHCSMKPAEEHSGLESYVSDCMMNHSPSWIPIGSSLTKNFAERNNNNNSNSKSDNNTDASMLASRDEQQQQDETIMRHKNNETNNYYNQYKYPNNSSQQQRATRPGTAEKKNSSSFVAFAPSSESNHNDKDKDKKILMLEQKIDRMESMLEKLTEKLLQKTE